MRTGLWLLAGLLAVFAGCGDQRDADLKALITLYKEGRATAKSGDKEKMKDLEKKFNEVGRRLTGIDPQKEKDRFNQELFAVLKEAAEKHDPSLVEELNQQNKRREQVVTRVNLMNINQALQMFRLELNRYPTEEEGLQILVKGTEKTPPSIQDASCLKDSWGRPIVYEPADGDFKLYSVGPDGKAGTEDDVVLDQ